MNPLVSSVIDGIQNNKGQNITVLDLRAIDSTIADYFVICEGNSNTQVDSIADSVEDTVREQLSEKPLHIEGRRNSLWVLMDYSNVILHIFTPEMRQLLDLEQLWSDAQRTDIPNLD